MRQLLWKEWHEQSWKLAFGCLVLGSLALIGLHSRVISDRLMTRWVCFLGLSLLPVLSSTGLIPAERAEGSFESLVALPVSPWRILGVKTGLGVFLCAAPMFLAGFFSLLVGGAREISNAELIDLYVRSVLTAVSLFIWMLAVTSRLPSEARAGLVAIGVLIMWLIVTDGLSNPSVPRWVFDFSPCAFVYGFTNTKSPPASLALALFEQLPVHVLLLMLTVQALKRIA